MKILYYSPHPHLNLSAGTGYATHMREMIAAFKELGHTVHFVIRGGTDISAEPTVVGGQAGKQLFKKVVGKYIWRSLKEAQLLRFDAASKKLLETEVENFLPDLIYERTGFLYSSGAEVAAKYGIQYITEVNAPFEEEVKGFEGASSFYSKTGRKKFIKVLQGAKCVCTVSSALKDFLVNSYSISAKKVIVTPNAINPSMIHIDQVIRNNVQEEIVKSRKVIGFVGSIFPYHGVDLLIKAFCRIQKEYSEWMLLIVGDGYLIPELEKSVVQLGCENHVVFTGSIKHKDVFSYIDCMDIAVMARSNWYGSPVKIFEYGAMNKPIIAPDTIPVRDVMENGRDGLLIQPVEEEIYLALKKFIENPVFAKDLANNFSEKVLSGYTWKHIAERVLLNC